MERYKEEIMEKDIDGQSSDERRSLMTSTTMKSLDFARNLRVVVASSVILISCFLVVYLSFYTNNYNFGHFLGFSSSFYSLNAITTTADPPAYEPVHDEYYELRKALNGAATEDKTVILTTLNDAWAEPNNMFDLFLESFRRGNNTAGLLSHALVIAVDKKAYSRCQEEAVTHCYFFKSRHSGEMAHEARFMTPIYLEMMWERLDFLRAILTLGYNFVFTDTDVMWFRDPFPHFYPDIDFQTSCDNFNGHPSDLNNAPNNGFNFVRSNNRTIKFYEFWVSSRWKYPHLHEQNVFNEIKHGPYIKEIGLSIRFLDTDYFGGFCSPSKDFNKVCTMHANCCIGLDKKIADLNATLEDWKRYVDVSSTTNQTVPTHWRAPDRCRKWD